MLDSSFFLYTDRYYFFNVDTKKSEWSLDPSLVKLTTPTILPSISPTEKNKSILPDHGGACSGSSILSPIKTPTENKIVDRTNVGKIGYFPQRMFSNFGSIKKINQLNNSPTKKRSQSLNILSPLSMTMKENEVISKNMMAIKDKDESIVSLDDIIFSSPCYQDSDGSLVGSVGRSGVDIRSNHTKSASMESEQVSTSLPSFVTCVQRCSFLYSVLS